MRYIYDEELNVLWDDYSDIMNRVGLESMLTSRYSELKNKFALKYKQVYYQVKLVNMWKPENVMKYNLLKLRRLFAIWQENNIILIEGGIEYSINDKYKKFPKYNKQNPIVYPTEKTINKFRVKALVKYAEENGFKDLRALRGSLIKNLGLSNERANFLIKLYAKMQSKRELNNYSEQSDFINK